MSNVIKAIDRSTVHRICSGQVVLSLAIAVKELVENAIDAGATVVEVRLKEYGSELIEVSDNGHGVHPDNYEGLTLKHHTSKLRDFADLTGVETFGFRGEALSSLCALSELSVSTRHTSLDCGTNLTFDRNGRIVENVPCARQIGTTVSLVNIFSTLPVRHKEFHRNLKKEFNKMLQLLYAYCLVSTGVRISCSNHTKKGGKSILLSTQGNATVKENVSSIFGAKQLAGLLVLKETLPSPDTLEELRMTADSCSVFRLDGLISSCAHGSGRGAPDRQFYFINSRPCEPSKISRTVNEVYHQYNLHQYPFVFLNISVAKESVDVNVTPDKRQIFLDNEKLLVAIVKASLEKVFKSIPSTFVVNNIASNRPVDNSVSQNDTTSRKPSLSIFSQWRSKNDSSKRSLEDVEYGSLNKVQKLDPECVKKSSQLTLSGFVSKSSCSKKPNDSRRESSNESETSPSVEESSEYRIAIEVPEVPPVCTVDEVNNLNDLCSRGPNCAADIVTSSTSVESGINSVIQGSCEPDSSEELQDVRDSSTNIIHDEPSCSGDHSPATHPPTSRMPDEEPDSIEQAVSNCSSSADSTMVKSVSYDTYVERDKKYMIVPVDISFVKSVCDKRVKRNNTIEKVKFRAAIDPSTNDAAESELQREISKDKFEKMEIIGQFNLGFIIAKLDQDLFIIDQHASDEKYNFETLQKTTTIRSQHLVLPQLLELTAANELVLTENLEIFKRNGFEFKIDEEAPPTRRVSMTAVPLSVNRVFGKEDVDELLFMLQDAHDKDLTCRPSGVRAMFASRACRKSVMIGTALDHKEMKRLVSQMGTIEHPWNCPHGRPTMRHLANMELVKKFM